MAQLKCLILMKITWKKYLDYITVKIHQAHLVRLCDIFKKCIFIISWEENMCMLAIPFLCFIYWQLYIHCLYY